MGYADTIINSLKSLATTAGKQPYRTALEMMNIPTYGLPRQTYKPTVSKTMVVPDYVREKETLPMTPIDPDTGMAVDASTTSNMSIPKLSTQELLALMSSGGVSPLKYRETQTTTPYARESMMANRAKIGETTKALNEALAPRESWTYSLANALSNIPQQQGYGTWLTDFARAFGGAFKSPTDSAIDRAKTIAAQDLKDLEMLLKYDKEMGNTIVTNYDYTQPQTGGLASLLFSE